MIGLFRNENNPDKKHEGLTQFLIDMKSDGLDRSPGSSIWPVCTTLTNASSRMSSFRTAAIGKVGNG